jgi:hypothetical protein
VEAQLVLQYQMPRSQTHRLPLASHCDSPTAAQAVPMAGNVVTVVHTGTGGVPPVALPPAPVPPVPPRQVPPEQVAPVTHALPHSPQLELLFVRFTQVAVQSV